MLFLHTLFIFTLYRAAVDTSPVTEGFTLFKHRLFIIMFPNNPRNLKPGHTLVFKEKDLIGLVSTPLFGFSDTIFLVKLCNKCF